MCTEEDHPEEVPMNLMILDCQEEDCLEEDHPEEDCPDPPWDPQEDPQAQGHQEDCHPEMPETIEIKLMDSDSTWK